MLTRSPSIIRLAVPLRAPASLYILYFYDIFFQYIKRHIYSQVLTSSRLTCEAYDREEANDAKDYK
jgi:hypothetical protein